MTVNNVAPTATFNAPSPGERGSRSASRSPARRIRPRSIPPPASRTLRLRPGGLGAYSASDSTSCPTTTTAPARSRARSATRTVARPRHEVVTVGNAAPVITSITPAYGTIAAMPATVNVSRTSPTRARATRIPARSTGTTEAVQWQARSPRRTARAPARAPRRTPLARCLHDQGEGHRRRRRVRKGEHWSSSTTRAPAS